MTNLSVCCSKYCLFQLSDAPRYPYFAALSLLCEQLMRAMAAEAEAAREARAKVDLSHVPYSEQDSGF